MRTTSLTLLISLLLLPLTSFAGGFNPGYSVVEGAKGAQAMRCIQDPRYCESNSASSGNSPYPFCLMVMGNKQCNITDGNYCRQTAAPLGGMCVTNPDFNGSVRGSQPFCVISISGTNCNYFDVNTCNSMAQAASGGCIPNPKR